VEADGAFPVKGYSLESTLHSVPDCQKIVKKAIARRLGQKYGMEQLPETGAVYQVQFAILHDRVTLLLDTSGAGLHKRGYRAVGVRAPLWETLAAAMVTLARYRGKDAFCDPFCGSGTIVIEAALIAKNRAPGLDRSFSAQKWKRLPAQAWMDAADEAMDKEFDGNYDIWGGDISPHAIEIAKSNAEKAGVEDLVRFETADATKFYRSSTYGQLVTNPPYGERLLEKESAGELYRAFGQATAKLPEKWRVYILSSHDEFEKCYGSLAAKKRKLYNGMIKCDLFMYFR
jgi:putative N6-adenine-specific DNA methylase